jgi:hypothetical protein
MIKGILFFAFVWILVVVVISLFRSATSKERLSAAKTVLYGALTALIATILVVFLVVLF